MENPENVDSIILEIWLNFVSSFFESASWPIGLFAVAFLFRQELRQVAKKIKRVKWGDAEAEFGENISEVKEAAKSLDPVAKSVSSENDNETYTLLQQAEVSPTGAVIDAYKNVEEVVLKLAHQASDDVVLQSTSTGSKRWTEPSKMPSTVLVRRLRQSGWLSLTEQSMLEKLRETRNLAVHSKDASISSKSAKEFIRIADKIEDALRSKIQNAID